MPAPLFDTIARSFRDRYDRRRAFRERRALFGAAARAALGRVRGRRCLDLGCGPGVLARDFAALGFDTLGVDASANMIALARAEPSPARFVQADLQEFLRAPQPPAALVVASSVLEYLDDPLALLRAVAALLEPGGTFLFSIPNRRSALRAVEPLLQRFAREPYLHAWKNRLALAHYLELAHQLGLRVEQVRHFGAPLGRLSLLGPLTLVTLVKP